MKRISKTFIASDIAWSPGAIGHGCMYYSIMVHLLLLVGVSAITHLEKSFETVLTTVATA